MFGGTLATTGQHCSPELCVSVCLCVSKGWECNFWPGYVCRRAIRPGAQNQSVEPTDSGQVCNLCMCVNNTHTHTQILGHTDTHIMHMRQTNKQINKQKSRFSFPVSLWKSLSHPQIHTCANTRSQNHHLSRLKNRLPIHHSVHSSRERPCAPKAPE